MKINNLFIQLAITLFLFSPALAKALEIREEAYVFKEETARISADRIFVMTNDTQSAETQPPTIQPMLVHFDIGSSVLSSTEAGILMSKITIQNVSRHTPLKISGHSCELGSNSLNLMLSLQRAVTVTNFLSNRGYTISSLHAEGEAHPIATNPLEYFLNRRVEISTQH